MKAVAILVVLACLVPAITREVTQDLLNALRNKYLEWNVELVKGMIVQKIEMVADDLDFASHWMARITVKPGSGTAGLLSAELNNRHERWSTWDQKSTKHQHYIYVDATVENPKEMGTNKPLTVARLIECVVGCDLKTSSAKCWLFTLRMFLFAKGLCECGKCLEASCATDKKSPLDAAVKLVEDNPTMVTKEFKFRVENWIASSGY